MEQSEKIGAYSIGVNILLVGMKGLLYLLSGSAAVIADAIHSSSDVISSVTVLAGIKISKRKSRNFPNGLYKAQNFVSSLSPNTAGPSHISSPSHSHAHPINGCPAIRALSILQAIA
jgi:predicted Co/Zn/Cd cation transporter (cation efflux family)